MYNYVQNVHIYIYIYIYMCLYILLSFLKLRFDTKKIIIIRKHKKVIKRIIFALFFYKKLNVKK